MDVEFGDIERHGLGAEYRLGLNVNDDGFSFGGAHEALVDRIRSRRLAALPDDCAQCPVRSVCRGAHPGSRFDDRDGSFNHASASCEAMYELSTSILHHLYQHGYGPHLADPALRELLVA
jgi:radical SAM protein with 4Fe4S-binding SPASM domain